LAGDITDLRGMGVEHFGYFCGELPIFRFSFVPVEVRIENPVKIFLRLERLSGYPSAQFDAAELIRLGKAAPRLLTRCAFYCILPALFP
jgi:hypothetical protein